MALLRGERRAASAVRSRACETTGRNNRNGAHRIHARSQASNLHDSCRVRAGGRSSAIGHRHQLGATRRQRDRHERSRDNISGKRLALIKEALPDTKLVSVLWNRPSKGAALILEEYLIA